MKKYTIILFALAMVLLLHSCYEPIEIRTDNAGKVEVPLRVAMPLVDGKLLIEYDSLVDFSSIGDSLISFENGRAYITYDTVIDFYDQLSVFLAATDIDLSAVTAYDQDFLLDFDVDSSMYSFIANISGVGERVVKTPLSVADSFEAKYGGNSLFYEVDNDLRIEGLAIEKTMNIGLDFDIYLVEIQSGLIKIDFNGDEMPFVNDDSLVLYPSARYNQDGVDTIVSTRVAFEILDGRGDLPDSVFIKANIKIPSFKNVDGSPFDQNVFINTLDTLVVIDIAGMYYEGNGDGEVFIDFESWVEVTETVDKIIIPLPDTLGVTVDIEDMKFEHVVFNYGIDTMLVGEQDIDIKVFDNLPEDFEINGFRIADPEIKLKLKSNLGFAARLAIDRFGFDTEDDFEDITNDGRLDIEVKTPFDPNSITTKIAALEDSLVIDSTTSRVADIDLFSIRALKMNYAVIVNPDDRAGNAGEHNFFYKYDSSVEESMYDVELAAQVRAPLSFRFDNMKYSTTMGAPFDEMDIDSMITMSENDSVNLNVKLWTSNFPLEMKTQFYFAKVNSVGGLDNIDSMFKNAKVIFPSSALGQLDSAEWSLSVDAALYDHLKEADSVVMKVMFAMDDDVFFQLRESDSVEIGYKFSVSESSVMYKSE